MAEFTPITTQEEFDAAITDRLSRQKAKLTEEMEEFKKNYSDYDELKKSSEDGKAQIASLTEQLEKLKTDSEADRKSIEDKDAEIAKYARAAEKTNIAIAKGLPIELASRLKGETKEELEADADKLLSLVGTRNTAPMASPEQVEEDGVMAAFKKMNPHIKI